ncbi:MAG: M48 family metallopeptidase [Dehalococcoidia bacterium]|nr:M48 family metallopeptidase [Dehalococcoidia bacterium]
MIVAAPASAPAGTIAEIVLRRARWILARLERDVGTRERLFVSGETLPYLGREVRMEVTHREIDSVRLKFRHWSFELEVPTSLVGESRQAAIRSAFVRWYRRRASDAVRSSVERWSRLMSLTPAGVAIRDQRRRWGSCAADGTLRFNWRIIMAEPALLEYVVVHEIVHLVHRNQGVVQIFCKGE